MKKIVSILLCLCMLLGLAACAKDEGGETTAAKSSFRVGYSKINITPSQPVELSAYVSGRIYEDILDYIYLTCVAISDENDNTVLMYSVDMLNMQNTEIIPSSTAGKHRLPFLTTVAIWVKPTKKPVAPWSAKNCTV